MLLIIDNYDSFTYNIYQAICTMTGDVEVVRNDRITLQGLEEKGISHLVISPGPGRPEGAGISMDAVRAFAGRIPILGVCLGHQCIGQAFGAQIVHAGEIMHGKTSLIHHNARDIFSGIENPFEATRYHSLVIERESLPDCLEITAWTQTEDGDLDEIMGVRHRELPVEGVQFHPESILTAHGHDLLRNFLDQ